MVQRKLSLAVQSHGMKPDNRFTCLTTSPKMKRSRPTKVKETISRSPVTPMAKQSFARVTDGSPNYMKGTTSSEARKDTVPRRKAKTGTKLGSGSGNDEQNRSSCRKSSLKMTKMPSFKRCSRIGSSSDGNLQKATCSSALKNARLPEYLMLNHGGTEAEGTTVLKLCPYTYCSLNGHLHAEYPPLKRFIAAKRRALKSQKGMKTETSSPRKENLEEIADLSHTTIEIYVEKKEEDDFSGEDDSQVSESLSEGAPRSEIDLEEGFEDCSDGISEVVDIQCDGTEILLEDSEEEIEITETRSNQNDIEISEEIEQRNQDEEGEEEKEMTDKIEFTRARKHSNREEEDLKEFKPREPNYLPEIMEPDSEKVDLKHNEMEERKNAEEWMIDYALQRTVRDLGAERKSKVVLLVEAFERVVPNPSCQIRAKEPSMAFSCGRSIQACN